MGDNEMMTKLQSALAFAGFSPGLIDGRDGPKTRAAIMAFQASRGLTADGIAGPQTMAALAHATHRSPSRTVSETYDRRESRLDGVHPDLVRVVRRFWADGGAAVVLDGVRTREDMWRTWGQGRTVAQCRAAGVPVSFAQPALPKVTWLRDPLMSNHRRRADGFGHAVDLGIVPLRWAADSLPAWDALAVRMFAAAASEGVAIRWGADWDRDGKPRERGESDSPHFELVA